MSDLWLYRLAYWASMHRIYWLSALIYRFRCPHPLIADHSVRACIEAGYCGCDNNPVNRIVHPSDAG